MGRRFPLPVVTDRRTRVPAATGLRVPETGRVPPRPMRVVLVAYGCDPTRGSEPGKGWRWAEALAERGHRVEILTQVVDGNREAISRRIADLGPVGQKIIPHFISAPEPPRRFECLVPAGLRGMLREFQKYGNWQREALRAARDLGPTTADMVHHVSYGSLVGGSLLRHLGPPLVFGPVGGGQTAPYRFRRYLGSGWKQEAFRTWFWVRLMSRRPEATGTVRQSAVVLVMNKDTADLAHRMGARDVRMMLSPAIPGSLLRKGPTSPPASEAKVKVLWVGRLIPIKAPALALEAFAALRGIVPHARFEFIGDGPLRAELEETADRLGLSSSVVFRGWVSWHDTLSAYDSATAMLFTSMRDSFGGQNLEAWARGLPTVCVGHQGVAEFAPADGAVCVSPGDPETLPVRLAGALADIIRDPGVREKMSQAAHAHAQNFTWEKMAEAIEYVYLQSSAE